jgi:integrase/recombinase XerD
MVPELADDSDSLNRLKTEVRPLLDDPDRDLADNTKDGYQRDIKHFNQWLDEHGAEITRENLIDYFEELNEEYRPATLNRKRSALIRALKHHFEDDPKMRSVVVDAVKKSIPSWQPDSSPQNVISKDQKDRMKAEATDRVALIIEFLWTTAVRVSELTDVRLSDCEPSQDIVEICVRGKGRKERTVFIPVQLYELIREEFNHSEKYLFETSGNNPYNRSNLYRQLDRLDVDGPKNPHAFRHGRASYLIETAGWSLKKVSEFLGHSSVKVTADVYDHNGPDRDDYRDLFESEN